jgi:hypothetical protein
MTSIFHTKHNTLVGTISSQDDFVTQPAGVSNFMTYSEKLKDPRWQKKRLEILNRDNWKCRKCESSENTLHVHHLMYAKEPWLVDNTDLITLCKNCHSEVENDKDAVNCFLSKIINDSMDSYINAVDILRELAVNNLSEDEYSIINRIIRRCKGGDYALIDKLLTSINK